MLRMAVVIAHLACLGCVHAQRQSDDELASRITTALLASDELNLSRIEVNVDDGTVYLSGMSDDHESKVARGTRSPGHCRRQTHHQ